MIQPSWKAFFIFSKKEVKGIIALGIILFGSVSIKFLFPSSSLPSNKTNSVVPHFFNFDPNTVDSLQAIELGIPIKQVTNLMHYRAKGGRFKNKEDFAKLYGLSPALFASLSPYIMIVKKENSKWVSNTSRFNYYKERNNRYDEKQWKIDINAASENEWQQKTPLPNYLIQRIFAYKKYRGGFIKPSEIAKVYGISDSIYQSLREHLEVNNKLNFRLNAKAMQFNDWKALGLFTDPQIWKIFKLKRAHEGIINWQLLVEALDLTQEEAAKLQSKVQFNN
jgi:DNA uptake protein ComE-like DNA-binding protein